MDNSDNSSALDNPDQEDYNRNNQQDVNVPAERVGTDHTQQPEGQEEDENKHQHCVTPFRQRNSIRCLPTSVDLTDIFWRTLCSLEPCLPGKADPTHSIPEPATLRASDYSKHVRLAALMLCQSGLFNPLPAMRRIFCQCGVEVLGCLGGRPDRAFEENIRGFNRMAVEVGVVVPVLLQDGPV